MRSLFLGACALLYETSVSYRAEMVLHRESQHAEWRRPGGGGGGGGGHLPQVLIPTVKLTLKVVAAKSSIRRAIIPHILRL